jgi:hypothetical protein
MKLFRFFLVLLFYSALVNVGDAQKITIALVNTKSFYASENGIMRLVDALESVNQNFPTLTAEEKDKEFKQIARKCQDAKDKDSKVRTVALDTKEEAVCTVIKDIIDSLEVFKKKQEFAILADISACSYVTHLCETAVDVTKQFIEEYNGVRK